MTIRLDGQVAVVTGGSRGIGAATVKLLAEAHANVVFSYRRAARAATELAAQCRSFPGERVPVRVEASKMRDAQRLIQAAVRRFGRIDIVVRSEEHTSELQSRGHLVCRLLLEKKKKKTKQ